MTRIPTLGLLGLTLMAALGGCSKGAEPKKQVQAGGEVLPGSASDAMLPLDKLTSAPPAAPKVVASGTAKGKPADSDKDEAEPASDDEAAAAPAPKAEADADGN